MPRVSAILFDIGNVLLTFEPGSALQYIARRTRIDPAALLATAEPLCLQYERGQLSTSEFLQHLRVLTGNRLSEEELANAWQQIFDEHLPMTALARWFARKMPVALLSNTNELHLAYLRRTFPVFEIFPHGVFSFQIGALKPEPRIYEAAAALPGLVAGETLFIDDLPANVAAARQQGFWAEVYDRHNHAAFLETLKSYGLPLPE